LRIYHHYNQCALATVNHHYSFRKDFRSCSEELFSFEIYFYGCFQPD
jgi:hypothetical protein